MKVLTIALLLSLAALAEDTCLRSGNLDETQVIFLGESHLSEFDHKAHLNFFTRLTESETRSVIVVAEMFDERSQLKLEEFGSRADFVDIDHALWKEQWGLYPYHLYRPLWDQIKKSGFRLTHLRPSPILLKFVDEEGVSAVMPFLQDFVLGPEAYRQHLKRVASLHLPSDGFVEPERMLDSLFFRQCFLDEYMSWRIAQLLKEEPEALVIVLVGWGHLDGPWGIPARLKRRFPDVDYVSIRFVDWIH